MCVVCKMAKLFTYIGSSSQLGQTYKQQTQGAQDNNISLFTKKTKYQTCYWDKESMFVVSGKVYDKLSDSI